MINHRAIREDRGLHYSCRMFYKTLGNSMKTVLCLRHCESLYSETSEIQSSQTAFQLGEGLYLWYMDNNWTIWTIPEQGVVRNTSTKNYLINGPQLNNNDHPSTWSCNKYLHKELSDNWTTLVLNYMNHPIQRLLSAVMVPNKYVYCVSSNYLNCWYLPWISRQFKQLLPTTFNTSPYIFRRSVI